VGGDAAQAPQHVQHVRSEDAAIGVQLVENDPAQAGPEAGPVRVRRQQRRMQHVRVRQQDVRWIGAQAPALGIAGVAIEDRGPEGFVQANRVADAVQGFQLILLERLEREEV
jgi:hypothetical protein